MSVLEGIRCPVVQCGGYAQVSKCSKDLNMAVDNSQSTINPLNTKRRPLYLKTQSVPRSKHFSSQL